MLQSSITFFLIGLFGLFLGMKNFMGLSLESGRILLYVFLALAIASFLASVFFKENEKREPPLGH